MSDALKPCPFCGGNDRLIEYHNPKTVLHPWYRIECEYCGAKGPGSDRGDHVQEWNTRAALSAPQPAAPQDAEIRCAVMGFGCVAIGQTKDQVTGQAGIIYLDMGEQRDIDADTCDLFAPGSVPDPKKVLAHIQFATADSVRQTIDELNALLVEHFGEHAAPAPAQAVPQWQPIGTAPRGSGMDGPDQANHPDYIDPPRILLFTEEGIVVGYYDWYYHPGYGFGADEGASAWRTNDGGQTYGVTHWMPLPAAPGITEPQGEQG